MYLIIQLDKDHCNIVPNHTIKQGAIATIYLIIQISWVHSNIVPNYTNKHGLSNIVHNHTIKRGSNIVHNHTIKQGTIDTFYQKMLTFRNYLFILLNINF